jgi:hypothetical protein
MTKIGWFSRLSNLQPSTAMIQLTAGSIGVAALLVMAAVAAAQNPTATAPLPGSGTHMSVPDGYSLHEVVDMGGHIANTAGSNAMYDTLVNLQSGPRMLGETFELRALPGKKGGLVDNLKLFSNGFGGDPNQFTRLNFEKGKLYDFSGVFRRDRQYFDYDLLGNPNIPAGKTIPIGPSAAPTSRFAWPQVMQSPEMFNTVRRMTDTNAILLPLSKVSFRAGYSQNIFQGPSLSPSGYQGALSSSLVLQEFQRNSTDDFLGAIDWKPIEGTKLTFEEQVNHYKADSYFTLAPQSYIFQEADGTKVVPFVSFDSMLPYGYSTTSGAFAASNVCNTGTGFNSMTSSTTVLNAPQTPGGLPVIDPACAVVSSYQRYQPTRILTPTETFRLQSTSIKNVSMNGNVRYTSANMSLPNYQEFFNGLTHVTSGTAGALRSIVYQGNANAKRKVIAADYGITWQAAKKFSLAEQISFSNVQQPGTAALTSVTALATTGAPNQTITYAGTLAAGTPPGFEGTAAVGSAPPINAGYFGQKFIINNVTGTWDVTDRATVSLDYRYQMHSIAEGGATHTGVVDDCPAIGGTAQLVAMCGTTTIHENTGIVNAAYRPTNDWEINGSVEIGSYDNVFTAVAPRQLQHYRVHTMLRPKTWATITGAYNDLERHNNTFNTQDDIAAGTIYYGPLNHVDHSRTVSLNADLAPNEHYGFNIAYSFNSVYTATNVCYPNGAAAWAPGAATPPGTSVPASGVYSNGVCQGVFSRGSTTNLTDWYGRVFMDAPTQFGAVSLALSPIEKFHANLGYRVTAVSGSQFFQDSRAVNGSLNSTYQSPFLSLAYALHKNFIWNGEYNYYGYGEGGVSGSQYCNTATPSTTNPNVAVVPCSTLAGLTAQAGPAWGFTAPRNFHANNVTLGVHYEF